MKSVDGIKRDYSDEAKKRNHAERRSLRWRNHMIGICNCPIGLERRAMKAIENAEIRQCELDLQHVVSLRLSHEQRHNLKPTDMTSVRRFLLDLASELWKACH